MTEQVQSENESESANNPIPEKEQVSGNDSVNSSENTTENVQTNPILEELNKAKKEIQSLKDSWARERAEFQNFKRRSAAEFLAVKKEALKGFVSKLLDPLDNLDKVGTGIQIIDDFKPFFDGVEMIKRGLFSILERENIFKVNPVGQHFDPTTMEAIASVESEEYSEEVVAEVYQVGYAMKDGDSSILLRPARVKVGRPKH